MTEEERVRWDLELQQIREHIDESRAQTRLALRRGDTEFCKIGIAALAAGAVLGGTLVGLMS